MPKAKAMKSRILAHRGAQPNGLGGCSASPWIYLRLFETAACMDTIDTLICARWVIPIEPVGRVLEQHAVAIKGGRIARSEERRVGKECMTRWSSMHKKKRKFN